MTPSAFVTVTLHHIIDLVVDLGYRKCVKGLFGRIETMAPEKSKVFRDPKLHSTAFLNDEVATGAFLFSLGEDYIAG